MIAYVRGVLGEKSPTTAVVEAAGVGYEMLIPLSTYERLPREGGEVKLLAFHSVREDGETLFGFATENERELFTRLTGVSGVGPKTALAILSGASVSELASAIASRDAKRISAIKGVGKKTAEKICVELRDKVSALAFSGDLSPVKSGVAADAVTALRALGFGDEASAKMVADVLAKNPEADDVEKVIKLALASR
jgi:Holliday junction DNA helicase RuvA